MSSEKTSLNIVYMGTPEFAVPPLEALLQTHHKVVGVITVADKPAGRGRKIQESAIKKCASNHDLHIMQPTNLKDEKFLAELASLEADLFIVVAFRMLPKVVWNMPRLGTFNLHGSLLPKYRGAAPIHWAVINGDKVTGLTTFLLDEKIDTGSILLQRTQSIEDGMTTGELHDALLPLGAEMVVQTTNMLAAGEYEPLPQDESLVSHAPKLNKENSRLDWSKTPQDLAHQIHGLNPFPGAYYGEYKFFKAAPYSETITSTEPKLVVINKMLMLTYALGSVQIIQLKPNGKRLMNAVDFINGMKDQEILL